ncbi:unnamed protein product [Linum trigynum]|uniref:Uncharacterized protein n=1 Tax=Linum trigynum TaxID=586398 RepID=A0AAV2EX97_9ROSI
MSLAKATSLVRDPPPNLDEIFENDPFAGSLPQAKLTPSLIPLGGCNGVQSMMSYIMCGKDKKGGGKKKRYYRCSLKSHQVHESSSSLVIPNAHNLEVEDG